jgi:hypothetical protein
MSERSEETYQPVAHDPAADDPAGDLLRRLRSALGHLGHDDLTDSLVKIIIQVWQVDSCRSVVAQVLE